MGDGEVVVVAVVNMLVEEGVSVAAARGCVDDCAGTMTMIFVLMLVATVILTTCDS